MNAVGCSDNPALPYQRSTAGDFLVEKLLLHNGHLPRVLAKLCILTADYFCSSRKVHLTTFYVCVQVSTVVGYLQFVN